MLSRKFCGTDSNSVSRISIQAIRRILLLSGFCAVSGFGANSDNCEALLAHPVTADEIAFQPASLDIWEQKYCLKTKDGTAVDENVTATYSRVARALSEQEQTGALREHWYQKFLWALQNGAIPGGRIISNVGAERMRALTDRYRREWRECKRHGHFQDG